MHSNAAASRSWWAGWLRRALLVVLLCGLPFVTGCMSAARQKPAPPMPDDLFTHRLGLGDVRAVAYSPDGALIGVASDSGRGYLFDATSHAPRAILDRQADKIVVGQPMPVEPALSGIVFLHGGAVVTADAAGTLVRWDADGRLQTSAARPASAFVSLTCTPDGAWALAGTADGHIVTWDTQQPKLGADIAASKSAIRGLGVTADGTTLYSAGDDGVVSSWKLPVLTAVKSSAPLNTQVLSLAVASNNMPFVGSADGVVRGLDPVSLNAVNTFGELHSPVRSLAVHGPYVVGGAENHHLYLWDTGQNGKAFPLPALPKPNASPSPEMYEDRGSVEAIAVSPDGLTVAAGGAERTVMLHETKSFNDSKMASQEPVELGHPTAVFCVAYAPGGQYVACVGSDQDVWLYDTAHAALARFFSVGTRGDTESVAFSQQGMMATGSEDGGIHLYDPSGKLVGSARHNAQVNDVEFSADASELVSGSWDHHIIIWKAPATSAANAPLQQLSDLVGHTNGVSTVAFSGDSKMVASSSWDQSVDLWNVGAPATPGVIRPNSILKGMAGPVFSVAVDRKRGTVLAGGWKGQVWAWGPDGSAIKRIDDKHADVVFRIAFTADGTHFATGSADRTVLLWDAATMASLQKLEGFRGSIRGLSYSPDGQMLAVGSTDGNAFIMPTSSGSPTPAASPSH